MRPSVDKINNALDIHHDDIDVIDQPLPTKKQLESKTIDNDFQYSRENLYSVIECGSEAMTNLLQLAQETEHPRAYEVLGQLMDKMTTANKELVNLHKQVKDITNGPGISTQNVTNALFVGSTAELQKMLKGASSRDN